MVCPVLFSCYNDLMIKYDALALGELLIDLTQNGLSEQGNPVLEANPGGAVCNVLSMLSKLGHKTAFIGKVGSDGFGKQLERALEEVNISTEGLCFDDNVRTTLAVVHNDEKGDRSFSFYRSPGADVRLCPDEVDETLFESSRLFHFGTLSFTDEPVRSASVKALELARKHSLVISFDPNLRESLWRDLEDAKSAFTYGMGYCDVLKISDNEIVWYTGEHDHEKAVDIIRRKFPNIKLVLLTLGKNGSIAYCGDTRAYAPAFGCLDVIDTTGAGDTFFGAMLDFVLREGLGPFDEKTLVAALSFANAAAGLVTTRKGALRVMPGKDEIKTLMERADA